ncbi:MAG: hypothetical protein JO287_02955, partial [Pseudonocardiales bacterium]|nr:hypothetical protein [Pseudonocardiales bacterium]
MVAPAIVRQIPIALAQAAVRVLGVPCLMLHVAVVLPLIPVIAVAVVVIPDPVIAVITITIV